MILLLIISNFTWFLDTLFIHENWNCLTYRHTNGMSDSTTAQQYVYFSVWNLWMSTIIIMYWSIKSLLYDPSVDDSQKVDDNDDDDVNNNYKVYNDDDIQEQVVEQKPPTRRKVSTQFDATITTTTTNSRTVQLLFQIAISNAMTILTGYLFIIVCR